MADDSTSSSFLAETPQRVLSLLEVSTSMFIVRFLSTYIDNFLSRFAAMLYSILIIQLSFLLPHDTLLILSRRISLLMIVEMVRPMARTWESEGGWVEAPTAESGLRFVRIHSLMVTMLVLCAVALVPARLAKTREGQIVLTAILYMYSDTLDFLALYCDMRLAVLALSFASLMLCESWRPSSRLERVLAESGASISVSVLHSTLLAWHADAADSRLLFLAMVTTLTYGVAFFLDVAQDTRDFMVFTVASELSAAFGGWMWLVVFGLAYSCFRLWPGPHSWVTQCVLMAWVNQIVKAVLGYIRFLAVNDTFVTLKTAAIVLQFLIHELSAGLFLL